jgi:hypothetical protein
VLPRDLGGYGDLNSPSKEETSERPKSLSLTKRWFLLRIGNAKGGSSRTVRSDRMR